MAENKHNKGMVGRVSYDEILDLWELVSRGFFENKDVVSSDLTDLMNIVEVLPADHEGSRYGHDGVRVEGSLEYIKVVLKMLSPMFHAHKEGYTKLETYMMKINPKEIKGNNNPDGNYVLYVRFVEESCPTIKLKKE